MRISKPLTALAPAPTCEPARVAGQARLEEIFSALKEFSPADKAQAAAFTSQDWYALSQQHSDPASHALWTKLNAVHKLLGEAELIQDVLRWPNPEAHAAEAYQDLRSLMSRIDYVSYGGFEMLDQMEVLARLGCVQP
jgi:hypothetical protein